MTFSSDCALNSQQYLTQSSPHREATGLLVENENPSFVIQDFSPLSKSIEWDLSRLYYADRGSMSFRSPNDSVPFQETNDGNLSTGAAHVFFSSLMAAETCGSLEAPLFLLELGPGSGLFARYFLDTLNDLCIQHSKPYYENVCYVLADQSERMLQDIERQGILLNHKGRYRLACIDALRPDQLLKHACDKAGCRPRAFRAVFLNYLLDSLPGAVLHVDDDGIKQLCVRTRLARGVDLQQYTHLTKEQVIRKSNSPREEDKWELLQLYPAISIDYSYRSIDIDQIPYRDIALSLAQPERNYILHNYAAVTCLERCLSMLPDSGFVLIGDYGYATNSATGDADVFQRFSGATAIGLNLSLFKAFFGHKEGCMWIEPDEDVSDIRIRLLGKHIGQETIEAFHSRFNKAASEWLHKPEQEARAHLQNGRYEAALGAFCQAIERQPRNWAIMGEAAKLLIFNLRDYSAGLEMSNRALRLNPCFSADLWNTQGDALFCLHRPADALKAFFRAIEVDPNDARARFNLAHYWCLGGNYLDALKSVAEGLAVDVSGEYRQMFIQEQAEILALIERRYRAKVCMSLNRIGPRVD